MRPVSFVLLAALAAAQSPQPLIRVNVNLVQIDATVTDKGGRRVSDLTAADVELFQDGKRQTITQFMFVPGQGQSAAPAPRPAATSTAPAGIKPEEVRRTIAIVIDDLTASFDSMAYIRNALKKYIDENVQPGDLVAIIRSSAGAGAFQQFTADRRQLLAAAQRVKFRLTPVSRVSAFAPIERNPLAGTGDPLQEDMARRAERQDREVQAFQQDVFAVGTLGAMNWVINGLRDLPGRKAIVLLSQNMKVYDRVEPRAPGQASTDRMAGLENRNRTLVAIRSLIDLANRAGVVVYAIDPRGLASFSMQAGDDVDSIEAVERGLKERRDDYFDSQQGLRILAAETGGLFFSDNNDLAGLIKKAADDQEGYYLIGYNPDDDTFDKAKRSKFHRLQLKVKRPGTRVRYRHGFYGLTDEDRMGPPQQPLIKALLSPFGASGIHVKLTPVFLIDKEGAYVQSMLHIDARDLEFSDEAAVADDTDQTPWRKALIELAIVNFGENGQAVGQTSKAYTVRLRGSAYQNTLKQGLIHTLHHPINKAGGYQLRASVIDRSTQKTGAASQFIDAPDIGKKRLAVSGVMLSSSTWPESADTLGAPAVRVFKPGEKLQYAAVLFNLREDGSTRKANIDTQVIVTLDGKPVFTGAKTPVAPDAKEAVPIGGELTLGLNMQPGEYELQFTVWDRAAEKKFGLASRAIDFEVRRQ